MQIRVGYFVNQYPKVSHSFIRREIAGVEACGIEVHRFSLRSCYSELIDLDDLNEYEKTCTLFLLSWYQIASMVLTTLLGHPRLSVRAWWFSQQLGRRSDVGIIKHSLYFLEACVLFQWCCQRRIDHLHVHFGTNAATVALLCRRLGGPSYSFTVHGPEEFDRAPGLNLVDKIQDASFVVAVSSFGRSQLYRLCPHDQWAKIQVVRCGIDHLFLNQNCVDLPAQPRLVCVGRLCPQKGQILLIEAVRRLHQAGQPIKLCLVGDGPLRGEIEAVIADAQLQDVVEITGWVSTQGVRKEILNAWALVLPSLAEGLPVVIMESLGLGRPVLSTYIAGIPELVESGTNGWLIPAGAVEELADSLAKILTTPRSQLLAMGAAGRLAAHRKHNVHKETRLLARLFTQVYLSQPLSVHPETPLLATQPAIAATLSPPGSPCYKP